MFISVDKKTGCVFETESLWDKERKVYYKRKKCIGKSLDGVFTPNAYYSERLAKEGAEEELRELRSQLGGARKEEKKAKGKEMAVAVSSRKKSGDTYALEAIAEKLGVSKALEAMFGADKASLIMSAIEYMVVSRCAAFDDFCYFDRDHEHSSGEDISSASSSRLFSSIGEDSVNGFFKALRSLAKDAGGGRHYSYFDSTAFSSYSGGIDLVEASKGKQDPELDHFALAAVYAEKTSMCSYYRLYRGNIPDIKTVKDFVDVAKGMGYTFSRLVFDRGYASYENIYQIHSVLKSEVMVMLKSSFSVFGAAVRDAGDAFRSDSSCYIPSQGVFAKRVEERMNVRVGDREECWHTHVHVYYSPESYAHEAEKVELLVQDEVERLTKALSDGELSASDAAARKFTSQAKSLISVVRTSNRTVRFEKDCGKVEERLSKAGCFCILATEPMESDRALSVYRNRDGVERIFNAVKNDLGFTRADVKSDGTLQGKVFCVMLAGMIITYIKNHIRDNRDRLSRKMTYNKLMHELGCVYTHMVKSKKVYGEISDRQNLIYQCLEIDPPEKPTLVRLKSQKKKNTEE
jgi:hypothetical protein